MKILFVGPLPPPLGGVAIINENIQNIHFEQFYNIVFDTSDKRERENLYSSFSIKNIFKGIKKCKALKLLVKVEKPGIANIFITSGFAILRDLIFLRILKKSDIPIIIHFHSKTKGEFALTPLRLKIVGKLFNKYADRIVLLSDYHFSFFTQYFEKDKCRIIENFVDYSLFSNSINDKTDEFLYVGRLTEQKGFFDLLYAVRLLKKWKENPVINIIGLTDNDENEKAILKFIEKFKLENNIILHGAKFGEDKYSHFKKAKCLIFPSHFENSPVVLKEGIAANMAIIASDIDANKNLLKNFGNYLFFEKGNIEDLALKIKELLDDNTKVIDMCKHSEKIKDYDISIAKYKIELLMQELL